MMDLVDACKDQRWSVRPKDNGFVVSPPSKIRRPGFESIFVFAPKDNHERKILAGRLKSAGLPISIVEHEVVPREERHNMASSPAPAVPVSTNKATVTVEPDVSTIERLRRKVLQIADLCTEAVIEIDKLEKEGEDVRKLKQLLKNLGD
jgi:hypothetical protein